MIKRGPRHKFVREVALRKAMLMFWEQGYEGTSTAALGKAMGGLCPPSVYAAFGNKEKLFREVVGLYRSAIETSWDGEATAKAWVEGMLRHAVIRFTQPQCPAGCLIFSATPETLPKTGNLRQWIHAISVEDELLIQKRLERACQEGDLPGGTDIETMVAFISAVLKGMSQSARFGSSREALGGVVNLAMATWPNTKSSKVEPKSSKPADKSQLDLNF